MISIGKVRRLLKQFDFSQSIKGLINKHKHLQQNQLEKYIYHYQKTRNEKSFQKVLYHCIKFIAKFIYNHRQVFKKYYPDMQLDEIFSVVVMLLDQAINKFNPKKAKQTKFLTFLYFYLNKIVKNTHYLIRQFDKYNVSASLDSGQDDQLKLINLIPDKDAQFDIDIEKHQQYNKLKEVIKQKLNAQQQQVIYAYFRFQDQLKDNIEQYQDKYGKVRLSSIAKKMNLSKARIGHIYSAAIKKIKPYME